MPTAAHHRSRCQLAYSPLDVIGEFPLVNAYCWDGSVFSIPTGSSISFSTMMSTLKRYRPMDCLWPAQFVKPYSYKDGDWNDPDTWTTDLPALCQATGCQQIPTTIILQGRTAYLTSNLNTRGLIININNGGTPDLRSNAFNEVVSIPRDRTSTILQPRAQRGCK